MCQKISRLEKNHYFVKKLLYYKIAKKLLRDEVYSLVKENSVSFFF